METTRATILSLPAELQTLIVQQTVKKDDAINLTTSNVRAGLAALISPFEAHPGLLSMAQTEVQRVNRFTLTASSSTVTLDSAGVPTIHSSANGMALTDCTEVRHLEVTLHNTLMGANWDSSNPVTLPTSTTRVLSVLPTVFPCLDSIVFKVINVGLVDPGATYTKWLMTRHATVCPGSRASERAARMFQLIRAVHQTVFPLWRRNRPVRKSMMFVQSIRYGAMGEGPCLTVRSGANSFDNIKNNGVSGNTERRMWSFCDMPLAKVSFI